MSPLSTTHSSGGSNELTSDSGRMLAGDDFVHASVLLLSVLMEFGDCPCLMLPRKVISADSSGSGSSSDCTSGAGAGAGAGSTKVGAHGIVTTPLF